jgi:hypothetical protein
MNTRRIFLKSISGFAAASAVGIPIESMAQAAKAPAAKLSESDPQAVALGYVDDTSRADQKKFPKHAASQQCSGCQLFQGQATDATGPCTIFAGKQVAAKGWCSAWVKKA